MHTFERTPDPPFLRSDTRGMERLYDVMRERELTE